MCWCAMNKLHYCYVAVVGFAMVYKWHSCFTLYIVLRCIFVQILFCEMFSRSAILTLSYLWRLMAQYTRYACILLCYYMTLLCERHDGSRNTFLVFCYPHCHAEHCIVTSTMELVLCLFLMVGISVNRMAQKVMDGLLFWIIGWFLPRNAMLARSWES